MAEGQIRFEDGAAYERMMGTWSRLAGAVFLEWLAPRLGLRWIDVGCGNGAFTELIVERCAPSEVQGIDPSDAQLTFARSRRAARVSVERLRAEDARQREERASRLLASIIETSDDAIVTKDVNGIVTSWNKGATRIFGFTADEMIGKPIITLVPPDRHDEEPEILERSRA